MSWIRALSSLVSAIPLTVPSSRTPSRTLPPSVLAKATSSRAKEEERASLYSSMTPSPSWSRMSRSAAFMSWPPRERAQGRDVVFEQAIDLTVGSHHAHTRTVASQLFDGLADGLRWRTRIESLQGWSQPFGEDHFCSRFAAQRAGPMVEFMIGVDRLPPQFC